MGNSLLIKLFVFNERERGFTKTMNTLSTKIDLKMLLTNSSF